MNKKELRLKYKTLRKALLPNEIEELSLEIANQVLKLKIWDCSYFHVFLPISEQNEVNTEYILHLLSGKDKEIVVAQSDFESKEMTHFLLTDATKIKKNQYNIPEPINGLEVPINKIDVVFVPLLAFDVFGNRVGYGKGFYDRFLSKCEIATIKIGLTFFEPEKATIEGVFDNDVKLNYVVTPRSIFAF